MQSLCTLRTHCRQWPRNTRYQADATPYLGRTCTGRIAPAFPGAPIRSSDHLVGAEEAPAIRGTGFMECLSVPGSLTLDVRRLDDRPPLFDFGFLQSAEGLRRL